MSKLRAVLHHRATNLVIALILVGTSLAEIATSLGGGASMALIGLDMRIGAADGVLAYGVMHLLRAIAEFFEDVERTVAPTPQARN